MPTRVFSTTVFPGKADTLYLVFLAARDGFFKKKKNDNLKLLSVKVAYLSTCSSLHQSAIVPVLYSVYCTYVILVKNEK